MKYKKLFITILFWIVAELFFNLLGIDEVIDWNDFVIGNEITKKRSYKLLVSK